LYFHVLPYTSTYFLIFVHLLPLVVYPPEISFFVYDYTDIFSPLI